MNRVPRLKHWTLATLVIMESGAACINSRIPQVASDHNQWSQWQTLEPVFEISRHYVGDDTRSVFLRVKRLLAKAKAKQANRELLSISSQLDRHWVAVAQANMASFYFITCIRGEAWKLTDGKDQSFFRSIDFSPHTVIQSDDLSVETMLTNLDEAIQTRQSPLVNQARIARSRVTSVALRCPANEQVARRAEETLRADLAILAAQSQLAPDLAYLWGAMQLRDNSAAAAQPFLKQARAHGYEDPSLDYVAALVALELGQIKEAFDFAQKAYDRFKKVGDSEQTAEVLYTLGEIELRRRKMEKATGYWRQVLKLVPAHPGATVGRIKLIRESSGTQAASIFLHERLEGFTGEKPVSGNDYSKIVENLELLIFFDGEDQDRQIAEILREGLLLNIDAEEDPVLRGLRYFYAATLEVRLGEIDRARGHAAVAESEIAEANLPESPVKVREFLDRLNAALP